MGVSAPRPSAIRYVWRCRAPRHLVGPRVHPNGDTTPNLTQSIKTSSKPHQTSKPLQSLAQTSNEARNQMLLISLVGAVSCEWVSGGRGNRWGRGLWIFLGPPAPQKAPTNLLQTSPKPHPNLKASSKPRPSLQRSSDEAPTKPQ